MKVFFDTNVYVAEALLGDAAGRMLEATSKSSHSLHERLLPLAARSPAFG